MIKTVEVIVIIALLIFSFFLGVKYSDSVKSRMSWLETQDEQEVELPDLSNENSEIDISTEEVVDPNAPALDNVDPDAPQVAQPSVAPVENAPSQVQPVPAQPAPAPTAPNNQR
ncbi:MAG: hypothetical protein EBT63_04545 [Proteobacteria bacterium]|nr:hypothetical protein [Pseudomonadota bacterium]NCA28268.1 hypothetical protein [Pseudomonadota bacterium]